VDSAALQPYAHYTLHDDGSFSVMVQGMPLCTGTTLERARSVAAANGLSKALPVWDARFGSFGVTWPRN